MRKTHLLLSLLVVMLAACSVPAPPEVLEEAPYQDPTGIYSLPYPKGWLVSYDPATATATFTPPEQADPQNPLIIQAYAVAIPEDTTTEEEPEVINALLEAFLAKHVDDDSAVYNTGQIKVGKQDAVNLDFGKPSGEGYYTGRVVLVYLPMHAVAFVGSGARETWEEFLPTFRRMMTDCTFFFQTY